MSRSLNIPSLLFLVSINFWKSSIQKKFQIVRVLDYLCMRDKNNLRVGRVQFSLKKNAAFSLFYLVSSIRLVRFIPLRYLTDRIEICADRSSRIYSSRT